MTSLPTSTQNRLQRLAKIPHIWEGDRLSVLGIMENIEPDTAEQSDCIVWLDASDGMVRSMDIVPSNMGQEAMVRALIKAIENPQNPAQPARPHKIVVKNRELQFLLRGVLQNLDIKVDYQPNLPVINELWHNFHTLRQENESSISSKLLSQLENLALSSVWENQPWDIISEEEIIKITINNWGIESLYICVMGMLGQEFGILLYRSIESLKNFRQTMIDLGESPEDVSLEEAFLQQDCWFLNFSEPEENELTYNPKALFQGVKPIFGSIHPYEGVRSIKETEEVLPIYLALKALDKFINEFDEELLQETQPVINRKYKLKIPLQKSYLNVDLTTMPEFTQDLEKMWDSELDENDDSLLIDTELIPKGTFVIFQNITNDRLQLIQNHFNSGLSSGQIDRLQQQIKKNPNFPVIILQTTRSKAKNLISQLQTHEGIAKIVFAQGHDTTENEKYDLGILQSGDNNLYLFAEIFNDYSDVYSLDNIASWKKQVDKKQPYCGVIIAMGATGASAGNPQVKDLLCVFYTQLKDDRDLLMLR